MEKWKSSIEVSKEKMLKKLMKQRAKYHQNYTWNIFSLEEFMREIMGIHREDYENSYGVHRELIIR